MESIMNVEDGDDLPIRVTFEELATGDYWHLDLATLPRVGEDVVIAGAPKGTIHRVRKITHHVGSGWHRVVINVVKVGSHD